MSTLERRRSSGSSPPATSSLKRSGSVSRLRDRPTADLIVIFLTAVVGFVLVATAVVGLILKATDDTHETSDLLALEGEVIKGFTTLIVGYIAGRGVNGVSEKNGGL